MVCARFPVCRAWLLHTHSQCTCQNLKITCGWTSFCNRLTWRNHIIIRCKFFFLFIGQELTTWPANKCLQIMVCSCAMSSNFVWLQIIFCSCVNETTLFSLLQSLLSENGRLLRFPKILCDRMKKQLLNSVVAKYSDLSVSRRSIICLSLWLRQIIDLLATDKSWHFAQPHPIIVNYLQSSDSVGMQCRLEKNTSAHLRSWSVLPHSVGRVACSRVSSLRKQLTFCDATTGFAAK